jgi:hypothetical protein
MNHATHFIISVEDQCVVWPADGGMPEIDIGMETVLAYFATKTEALQALHDYLAAVGARALWSDLRPIETCACCGADFNTGQRHMVVSLSEEEINEHDPEMPGRPVDWAYPARFCTTCVPTVDNLSKKMRGIQ